MDSMNSSLLSEGIVYCTALYLAAQNGHRDVVKYISELNVAPPSEEMLRCTSLYFAAQNGQLEMVRLITSSLINGKQNGKRSALKNNSENDKIDALLKVNVNSQDAKGNSALHYAAIEGNVDLIKTIISKGANINCKNVNLESALHCAAQNGHGNVVNLLLKKDANINCRDKLNNTPMHYAIEKNYSDVTKLLLENNAEMNIANNDKKFPLDYLKSFDLFNVLLKHGKNINVHDSFGDSLLHIAAKKNFTSAIATCIKAGIEINSVNFDYNTALHVAAEDGDIIIVKELLKYVHSYVKNLNGELPINLATNSGHHKIVELFLNSERPINTNGGNIAILRLAVENDCDVSVKKLLATKLFKDVDINSMLDSTMKKKNVKIIKMLLLSFNDVNNIDLATFIHFGNPDLIKLLLTIGVCTKPISNVSPLQIAVQKGNVSIVELILESQKNNNSLCKSYTLEMLSLITADQNIRQMLYKYIL